MIKLHTLWTNITKYTMDYDEDKDIRSTSTTPLGDVIAQILLNDVEEPTYSDKEDGNIAYIYDNIEQYDVEDEEILSLMQTIFIISRNCNKTLKM